MKKLLIDFSATKSFPEIDYNFKLSIRRAVTETLRAEGFPYDAEVSVTLCDGEYIRALNKKYRGIDRETDVLSFPLYTPDELTDGECAVVATLGDIVINLDRAKIQAEEIGHPYLREVMFLTVHSTLHLLGYDHERSEEDDEEQCRRQREIMEKI